MLTFEQLNARIRRMKNDVYWISEDPEELEHLRHLRDSMKVPENFVCQSCRDEGEIFLNDDGIMQCDGCMFTCTVISKAEDMRIDALMQEDKRQRQLLFNEMNLQRLRMEGVL